MQRVTPCTGPKFQPMEDKMRDMFLPDIFKGSTYQIPGKSVTSLKVKQAGIAIPEPTKTAGANWTASCVIT